MHILIEFLISSTCGFCLAISTLISQLVAVANPPIPNPHSLFAIHYPLFAIRYSWHCQWLIFCLSTGWLCGGVSGIRSAQLCIYYTNIYKLYLTDGVDNAIVVCLAHLLLTGFCWLLGKLLKLTFNGAFAQLRSRQHESVSWLCFMCGNSIFWILVLDSAIDSGFTIHWEHFYLCTSSAT